MNNWKNNIPVIKVAPRNIQKGLSLKTELVRISPGCSLSVYFDFFFSFTLIQNIKMAKIHVAPSTQNKPLYPTVIINNPPSAGPAAKPKLIANLTKVKARVLFSGFA